MIDDQQAQKVIDDARAVSQHDPHLRGIADEVEAMLALEPEDQQERAGQIAAQIFAVLDPMEATEGFLDTFAQSLENVSGQAVSLAGLRAALLLLAYLSPEYVHGWQERFKLCLRHAAPMPWSEFDEAMTETAAGVQRAAPFVPGADFK